MDRTEIDEVEPTQTVTVVADSACDLPPEHCRRSGIRIVPLWVHFGSEQFRDGVDLQPEEFFDRLDQADDLPTTAAPTPMQFTEVYDEIFAANGEQSEILVVSLTSKLSGTYSAASVARQEHPRSADIHVVDSMQLSIATGVLVLQAAKRAAQGRTGSEIAAELEARKGSVVFRAVVATLRYLKEGGRIGAASALLGSAMRIRPVLTTVDGEVAPAGRARTRADARNKIIKGVTDSVRSAEVAVIADSPEFDIRSLVADAWAEELIEGSVGCLVGTFSGPGAAAMAAIPNDPEWD